MASRINQLRLLSRLSSSVGWSLLGWVLIRELLSQLGQAWGVGLFSGKGLGLLAVGLLVGLSHHLYRRLGLLGLGESDARGLERLLTLTQLVVFGLLGLQYVVHDGPAELLLLLGFPSILAYWLGATAQARWLSLLMLVLTVAWTPFGLPRLTVASGWPLLLSLLPVLVQYGYTARQLGQLTVLARTQVHYLDSIASTDPLTRLMNRRQFVARLSAEMARARRHKSTFSLVLFDLDNFKRINDEFGHPCGDAVLRELADRIAANIRESDMAARYGGEEFALILPETRRMAAYDLMERLRQLVQATPFLQRQNALDVTVSIGVTQFDVQRHSIVELIQEADQALYQAKRTGKNRVVVYGMSSPDSPPIPRDNPLRHVQLPASSSVASSTAGSLQKDPS